MARLKLGLIGIGKIARDQHLPVLAASEDFELVAVASRNAHVDGLPSFPSMAAMLGAMPEIEAVSLCTPPTARVADARAALDSARHVMLEKPPAATLSDVDMLSEFARRNGVSLHASWHSRHAPAVAPARAWLREKTILSTEIVWKEDIRTWHPGQEWILAAGGFGVFDPGINALSIATTILPRPFALCEASLRFPENRQAPIAARLSFRDEGGGVIEADLDFLQTGAQTCDITVKTGDGDLVLSEGGRRLRIDGAAQDLAESGKHGEYAGVYAHFAGLVRAARVDADVSPLRHVADAFLLGRREVAAPFFF